MQMVAVDIFSLLLVNIVFLMYGYKQQNMHKPRIEKSKLGKPKLKQLQSVLQQTQQQQTNNTTTTTTTTSHMMYSF